MKIYNKTISACILSYKPTFKLVKSVEMLLRQKVKLKDIVIINTDKEKLFENLDKENTEKLKSFINEKKINIINIEKKDFDHGKTRNSGAKNLNCDYILFMTDDCILVDEYLTKNILDSFEDNIAVICARQIAYDDANFIEKKVRNFNYPDTDMIKDLSSEKIYGIKNYFCSNVCAAYDRNIFIKLGCFDTDIPLNEDMLYAYKAIHNGYKILYKSTALVYHSHNLSFTQQFKRNYLIGKSQKMNKEIFKNVRSEKEGKKLLKYILEECKKERRYFDLIYFIIQCIFRYTGYLCGKVF